MRIIEYKCDVRKKKKRLRKQKHVVVLAFCCIVHASTLYYACNVHANVTEKENLTPYWNYSFSANLCDLLSLLSHAGSALL